MSDQSSKRQQDMNMSQHSVEEMQPPTTWIYIPFADTNSGDQQRWADTIVKEHQQRGKHGRPHEVVKYDPKKVDQLKNVQAGDTILILGHGADSMPHSTSIHSHDSVDKGVHLPADQLARRLLAEGFDPKGVGIKVGACYAGGLQNPDDPRDAENEKLLAYAFATSFAQEVATREMNQPAFIDGGVGPTAHVLGLQTPDSEAVSGVRTHNVGRVTELTDQWKAFQNGLIAQLKTITEDVHQGKDVTQAMTKLTSDMNVSFEQFAQQHSDHRLSDNRVRYRIGGDEDNPQVSVDLDDLERAKYNRSVKPDQRVKQAPKLEQAPKITPKMEQPKPIEQEVVPILEQAPKEQPPSPKPLVQEAHPIQVGDQQLTVTNVNLPPQLFIGRDLSKRGGIRLGEEHQANPQMDKRQLRRERGKGMDFGKGM